MNGTDHQMPQPWLGRVVAEANGMQDDYHFVVTSLQEYLPQQPTEGLPTVAGELRSGARANLLMGVASNRVDVHQAVRGGRARARTPVRAAGDACSSRAEQYPHSFLALAWKNLVLNSAHDSSCACSHDEVVDHVLVRYHEARQIGDGLVRDALHALASEVDAPPSSTVVVNPTARARVRDRRGHCSRAKVRVTSSRPTAPRSRRSSSARSPARSTRPWSPGRRCGGCSTSCAARSSRAVRSRRTTSSKGPSSTTSSCRRRGRATRAATSRSSRRTCSRSARTARRCGCASWSRRCAGCCSTRARSTASAGRASPASTARRPRARSSRPTPRSRTSTCASAVDSGDGTYTIETTDGLRLSGLGRLVDGGDGGDTYNYSPPADDLVVDAPGRGAGRRRSRPVRCGRASSSRRTTPGPRTRSATRSRARRARPRPKR